MPSSVRHLVCFALAASLAACSGSGRGRDRQHPLGKSMIPVDPSSRIAAALTIAGRGNPGAIPNYPGERGNASRGTGGYPGQADYQVRQRQQTPYAACGGATGHVEIFALNINGPAFVGDPSSTMVRYGGRAFMNSGIGGRPTGYPVPVRGLSTTRGALSQIQFVADGSNVIVSETACNSVAVVPVFDTGGVGVPYRIGVGPNPTEIATARTAWGNAIAVAAGNNISLLIADRADARTGTSVVSSWRERIRVDAHGTVNSLAFGPEGRWLFVGYNPVNNAGGGEGRVDVCHVGTMVGEPTSFTESYYGGGFARGCFPGNPALVAASGLPYNPGIGSQRVSSTPHKLAVNDQLAFFLSQRLGPYRLATPNIAEIDTYADSFLPVGYLEMNGTFGGPRNLAQTDFRDIAIHPRSNHVLAIEGRTLLEYTLDNAADFGNTPFSIDLGGGDPVAMALDPGSIESKGKDAEFILVADAANNKLLVGRLDEFSVRFNRVADFIPTIAGSPQDVTIRTRTQFRQPFVPVQVLDAKSR